MVFHVLPRVQQGPPGLPEILLESHIPNLKLLYRGKVRDSYDIEEMFARLFVATDRISAFDVVMPNGIPDKGRVLTQMTLFWLEKLAGICPNHLITADLAKYPAKLAPYRNQLEGRSMIVKKVDILPVECIVRGYLAGSGWKDYKKTGGICGWILPYDLKESDKLPRPIFTPSTKAESGHDENISFAQLCEIVDKEMAELLRDTSIKLYQMAADFAALRGIIIADTKFEFGIDEEGNLVLADEVLTPDSSRFWDAERYEPGRAQNSFDKQYVRDWLDKTAKWNHEPPAPTLPDDVIARTREKYLEAYTRLTGKTLS